SILKLLPLNDGKGLLALADGDEKSKYSLICIDD
ncbi:unnamed protein product, partial [Rotaria magnacalcarata]